MGRSKRGLLHIGEIIGRELVEIQDTHVDERELAVWPDFRKVKGIPAETLRLLVGHNLDLQRPSGIIAPVDRLHQVTLRPVGIRAAHGEGFGMREVLDTLERLEVEFHPDTLLPGVEERKRMAAVAVHVPIAVRRATVAHEDEHLLQAFRVERPEVPSWSGSCSWYADRAFGCE